MYSQMTASSWIYRHAGDSGAPLRRSPSSRRRHFGGSLASRLTVTTGLGRMGGANHWQ